MAHEFLNSINKDILKNNELLTYEMANNFSNFDFY